jgi:redox-sensitive bicupin YhaK (pirin superfamily)
METVTFIIEGDIMHKDSQGYQSIIRSGGIQWMTAGRGLIHAEVSSDQFKKEGGPLEILQLWVNLPAKLKMAEPFYQGFQKEDIPVVNLGKGVQMQHISGEFQGKPGAYQSLTGVFMSTITLQKGSNVKLEVSEDRSIFFYVVRGSLSVNEQSVAFRHLVTFTQEGTALNLSAEEEALILFGHADPLKEPVVAQGPFVMNTEAEIEQAYLDYRQGKFGFWKG